MIESGEITDETEKVRLQVLSTTKGFNLCSMTPIII